MHYYLAVLKKYAVFSGRAQRAEYWYFTLFNIIILLVLSFVDNVLGITLGSQGNEIGILSGIYALAMLIPGIAVSVRRLHDTGKSAWMILVNLIPLIGAIWFLILMVIDSDPKENKYGPNPKAVMTA